MFSSLSDISGTSEFFNPTEETLSQDELQFRQNEKLKNVVRYVVEQNEFMRNYYAEHNVNVNDFRGIEDMASLPMVSKETFRKTFPLGLNCVAKEQLREMHMSSGSTGAPVVMPYTQYDLEQWAECMARCYRMAGGYPGDPVQITPTFGLFNGGFGMYHGARAADLFVVPTGSGNTERQIQMARTFKTKIIGAVISYSVRLIEVLQKMNLDLPDLKIGVFGAESVTEAMKNKIHAALGIEVFNIYGMTETGGVGTLGMDCRDHSGIHVWEDHYYLEIVDPATHLPLPDGQFGELVVTSLTREALPVIRFRTGDLTRVLSRKKCDCGRTHLKIDAISGRTDDMLIIKGVNFFPTQVEQALLEIPGVYPHYQIIIEETAGVKDIRIHVEAEEGVTGYQIEKHLKERLGFSPKGDIFKPGELPRQDGKAIRVIKKIKE
ncbi:MAG: phenylacetate--CoA ligase [Planctomycetia bacterium]|nr:phenylacetate--CoA ligase [Planctomycetia bacterium]